MRSGVSAKAIIDKLEAEGKEETNRQNAKDTKAVEEVLRKVHLRYEGRMRR
jgi:hypothetical protein